MLVAVSVIRYAKIAVKGMSLNSTESCTMPTDAMELRQGCLKRYSFWGNLMLFAMSTAILFILIEGLSSVLMSARVAKHTLYMQEESHSQYDADLGWSHRPNLHIDELYGDNAKFTTNSQGFRALENFDKTIPVGKYRIVTLGDSFTLGYGVGDDKSYPAQMQALCPVLQTVNMGQGGYGVDQDYLWYKRDGMKLDANVLIFAVIAHDFYRMTGDNFIGYGKPVLRLSNNTLVTGNVPVPATWNTRTPILRARTFLNSLAAFRMGHWLVGHATSPAEQFYGFVSDDVLATAGLAFDDLVELSRIRRQRFILVYLPISHLLTSEPTREATWLENYSSSKGVSYINLVPDFERLTPKEIASMFRPDYHYTERGNRFVAETLLRRLAEQIPDFPGCVPSGIVQSSVPDSSGK